MYLGVFNGWRLKKKTSWWPSKTRASAYGCLWRIPAGRARVTECLLNVCGKKCETNYVEPVIFEESDVRFAGSLYQLGDFIPESNGGDSAASIGERPELSPFSTGKAQIITARLCKTSARSSQ